MSGSRTHYDVLGVPFGARADEVAKRYKELLASAKSNLKSKPVDPDWLASAREAYVVLTDPQKRATYDKLIAAEQEVSAKASSSTRQRTHFLASAWRGEVRAWKLFWLMLLPAWLVSEAVSTWVGGMLVGLSTLWVPLPVLYALGFVVVLAVVFGAVFLWRCAFNVSWKVFGYAGRLFAVVALASFAAGLAGHVTGKTQVAKYARIAAGESPSRAPVAKELTLLVAARQGDLAQVRKLLDRGENPNVKETEGSNLGRTPLHYAAGGKYYNAKGQHLEVATLLLARGADVNAKGDTGYTPLHVASGLGQVEMVEFLLKNGALIDAKDVRGTPLAAAVLQGHEPVVEYLIKNKASLKEGLGALIQVGAYTPAHTAILKRLVDTGADPDEELHSGYTIFDSVVIRGEEPAYFLVSRGVNLGPRRPNQEPRGFKLAELGYLKALQLAFDKGFDPATRGPVGETLIHVARTPEMIDLLLAKGLRVDQADDKKNQPLHFAARRSSRLAVEYLLVKGASVNATNDEGTTPLMLASTRGGDEAMKLLDQLLEKGADVRLRDKQGFAALDHAVSQGNDVVAKRLLDKGADAQARDARGYAALHRARGAKIAELLVSAGANAKLAAADGKTPLHLAAVQDEQVVEVLLKQGADVNAIDKSGQTPLFSAVGRNHIFQKLLEVGARVDVVDNEGRTPLHYAAARDSEVAKTLVGKGLSLSTKDKYGNTPLHEAARLNRSYLAQGLIEMGADPSIKNLQGKTAQDLAEEAARAQAQKTFTKSPQSAGGGTREARR